MIEKKLTIKIKRSPIAVVNSMNSSVDQEIKLWELSKHFNEVESIALIDSLNFLTSMEADTALLDIFNTLAIDGSIYVETEDFDSIVSIWQDAVWDEDNIKNPNSNARIAFARLFGMQRYGNPTQENYDEAYSDTYKSAYNLSRLSFLLERAGFVAVNVRSENGKLIGTGIKSMQRGERQIAKTFSGIRTDHINRYKFAAEVLKDHQPKFILDLACGIGYGSALLASSLDNAEVCGVDIDKGAIAYANQFYRRKNNKFILADARAISIENNSIDAIVSFETIEHIDFDEELISKFYNLLSLNGVLIISTPNQDVMPYDANKFKFHVKHYKVSEIKSLVEKAGFYIKDYYQQKDPIGGDVMPGKDGAFTILICYKKAQ